MAACGRRSASLASPAAHPIADGVLKTVYFAEVVWLVSLFLTRAPKNPPGGPSGLDDLQLLLVLCAATAAAVMASSWLSGRLGAAASRALLGGAPFNDPLARPRTMEKLKATVWQLLIHAVMTYLELAVLTADDGSPEPWFEHPMTETPRIQVGRLATLYLCTEQAKGV